MSAHPRVLITGAAGFVGAALTEVALGYGADVLALDRPRGPSSRLAPLVDRIRVLEADLGDPASYQAALERFAPDLCFHLAWYAEPGQYLTSPKNIESLAHSLALLQMLNRIGCPQTVATGTCAEYDTRFGYLREDTPCDPKTIYAATKLSLAITGKQLMADAGGRLAWARLFYLFGPGEDPRRLVPAAFEALKAGRPFPASGGRQIRDYLHVSDVAEALWALGAAGAHGDFNVASGNPVSIAELLTLIGDLIGRRDLIQLGALPYREWDPMFICGDRSRLTAHTGWAPRLSLEAGLRALAG